MSDAEEVTKGKSTPMEALKTTLVTAGGRIVCVRCHAKSKRTQLQCGAPAMRGKSVCKTHGGRSTGPRTEAGKAKVAAAHWKHGHETRAKRELASEVGARLKLYARLLGLQWRHTRP
jgi:hypothetical protein